MSIPFRYDDLERNPEACCGNCAYYLAHNTLEGFCNCQAQTATNNNKTRAMLWCGDHPNFWRVKQEPKTEADVLQELQNYGNR